MRTPLILLISIGLSLASQPIVLNAVIEVSKGVDQSPKPIKEALAELEGSTLELGSAKCEVHEGKCSLSGIQPGMHIATAQLKSKTRAVAYRLLSVNGSSMVRVNEGPQPTLTYFVERYADAAPTPAETEAAAELPHYSGTVLDNSLRIELWVRLKSESENGNYERQTQGAELDGITLKLGPDRCVVKNGECRFTQVHPGKFTLQAEFPTVAKVRFRLAAETKPITIIIDPWTHRPKVEGWSKGLVVLIEKSVSQGS